MAEHNKDPDEGVVTRRTAMLGAGGVGIFGICLLYTSPSPRDS